MIIKTKTEVIKLGDFIKMKRLDMGFTIEELCKNAQVELEVYCAIENNLTLNPGIEDLFYLFKGLGITFTDFDFKGYVSNIIEKERNI